MAAHFNGRAAPELKEQAAALRHQWGNRGLHPGLAEIMIGDVRYVRYPDGVFRDEQGKKTFDPQNVFLQQEDDALPPWLHEAEPYNMLDFTNMPAEIERAWAVKDWFPMLETVGFAGPGGEGKTTILQACATAAALGTTYLGLSFAPMKASLLLCEDRTNDAFLRQIPINRHFGCTMKDLAGRLLIIPRRQNKHNYLGIFDADGVLQHTTFFHQHLAQVKAFGAQFNVVDTRADVFWGNQNDERHARQFVRQVPDRIAEETDGVCLLAYQPSRAGRTDGTSESGSVQWDAAFRARVAVKAADDTDVRTLTRIKSNFSVKGEKIDIRWHKGVFVREEEVAAMTPPHEIAAKLNKTRDVFLAQLDRFTAQNQRVSSSNTAANYAPRLFADHPAADGCDSTGLAYAMRQLFDSGEITNATYGPPSKGRMCIVKPSAV